MIPLSNYRFFGAILAVGAALIIVWLPHHSLIVLVLMALAVCVLSTPIAALILLLMFAPMHTLLETELPFKIPAGVGILLLGVVVATWIMRHTSTRQPIICVPLTPLYIPVGIFLVATLFTAFVSVSLSAWITEWLKWFVILALIVLMLNMEKQWRWLIFGLVLAATANAVIGLYIFLGGSGALHLLIRNGLFRAFGTFGQPNPFGGYMGLISPISIMAAYGTAIILNIQWNTEKALPPKLVAIFFFFLIAAALLVTGVFVSWSRGAWLGFGGSIIMMLAAIPKKIAHNLLVIVTAAAIFALALATDSLPASIGERIRSSTQELFVLTDVRAVDITVDNYPIVERLAHWQAAIRMVEQSPWLGVGFGNYEVVYGQYRLMNWQEPLGHAHNYYLNVFAEAGIIGVLSYSFMLVFILWMIWQTRKHPDTFARSVTIGLLGTWTYLLLHSLTDNLYVNNLYIHIGVILGLLAVLNRQVFDHPEVRMGT